MLLSNSSSSSDASSDVFLSSYPHPDSFEPTLVQKLRSSVHNFDSGSAQLLTDVTKTFESAKAALDHAVPAPGQREHQVGDRVCVTQDLRQRDDLNACVAVVTTAADAAEREGRVEVSVRKGRQKQKLWIKLVNLRLEWHVAADAHADAARRPCADVQPGKQGAR
jgi:hypothetical protein